MEIKKDTINKVFGESEQKNVGNAERIFSVVIGAWLASKAFTGKNKLLKALLGSALMYRGGTGYCPMYKKMGVDGTSEHNRVLVESSVVVNKSREEVYKYWRRLENLPIFMKHLDSVREIDNRFSDWAANIPGGLGKIDWKAEIIQDVENESIKWKSTPESKVMNSGLVRFIDAGELGTEIMVNISYDAPAGTLGAGVANLLTPAFEKMIRSDIERFKDVIEA